MAEQEKGIIGGRFTSEIPLKPYINLPKPKLGKMDEDKAFQRDKGAITEEGYLSLSPKRDKPSVKEPKRFVTPEETAAQEAKKILDVILGKDK